MLLIYSEQAAPRLNYIARLLLTDLHGIPLEFTSRPDEFETYQGPKICYSQTPADGGLRIRPVTLLFEKTVYDKSVETGRNEALPVLFPTSDTHSFPFDVFAASFYLVTRYEEYISANKDKFGRFLLTGSLSQREGLFEQPVVNIWARLLVEKLSERFPSLQSKKPAYRFRPTIDVDHAFAYKGRGVWRTLGGYGRSLKHGRAGEIRERTRVLLGLRTDPFDTFGYIRSFHASLGIQPGYFILFADYKGHDNNVSLRDRNFRNLLTLLADETTVGIHPSLSSNRSPKKLLAEIEGLSAVTGREITSSRQHFLKFSFPKTFRHLLSYGITDDYSMGFATGLGFRAGIASPFPFFDLYRNEATPLTIHPVSVMDVTLREYLNLTPATSISRIKQMTDLVRSVGGEFVSLWHNESLSDTGKWKGWRRVFEETTAYAAASK